MRVGRVMVCEGGVMVCEDGVIVCEGRESDAV